MRFSFGGDSQTDMIFQKVASEVLRGSGNTNSPEPEELAEIRVEPVRVKTNGKLHSIQARLQRRGGNRTFHKYAGDLWSIRANRRGLCVVCGDRILVNEEITLFAEGQGWAHMNHAVDQPAPDRRLN